MRTAVVIGATSGIGKAVALSLLEKGWCVAIAGRRLQALESIREQYPDRTIIQQMDVTLDSAAEDLDAIMDNVSNKIIGVTGSAGAPDLLLYVSGVGYQNRELDMHKEIVTVRTNCEGMVRVLVHFMKYVRIWKNDGIVTGKKPVQVGVVTSVAGTDGLGIAPAYSATKKMQSTYMTSLCQLCAMEGLPVKFSDIRPGFVATDILSKDRHYPMMISAQKAAQHILRGLSKGRRVIIFDWRFKLIVFAWRLIPRFVWERLKIVRN